ncbi:MAG: hypothetical protein HZC36_13775 [Armatimonadetes bacterium]|nr:hypothetical protein [Armatimonadota bacterium]
MPEETLEGATKRGPVPFHPFLFALHPVLSLYAANVSLVPFQDTLLPVAWTVGAVACLWGLCWGLLRDIRRAAIVASVLAYFFFLYDGFYRLARNLDLVWYDAERPWMGQAVWCVAALMAAFLVSRPRRAVPMITLFMNVTGCAMVGLAGYSAISSQLSIAQQLQAAQAQLARKATAVAGEELPDIYYIVLDGYGRSDVLKELYGLDNEPFLSALRARGFFVADRAQTNYVQTELSIASSTNFDYLQDLPKPSGSGEDMRGILDGMIDDSRFSRLVKQFGYQYVGVATGFPALRFSSADVTYSGDSGQSLYLSALLEKTPIQTPGQFRNSMFQVRYDLLKDSFVNLKRLGEQTGPPRFVMAHVLAPHPPFVFKEDGTFTAPKRAFAYYDGSDFMISGGTQEEYASGYAAQVKALNRMLLQTIDAILANGDREAVILLQGDHGPKLGLDQNLIEKTDLGEVLPILLAARGPDPLKSELLPDMTPVNLTRTVARTIFGQSMEPLPNRSYYSPWLYPYRFEEVKGEVKP